MVIEKFGSPFNVHPPLSCGMEVTSSYQLPLGSYLEHLQKISTCALDDSSLGLDSIARHVIRLVSHIYVGTGGVIFLIDSELAEAGD
ncbi:hypothetical protein V6N13_042965 [Hibiscus sabdariffa]|uniref:Uncharacterized protein n=1 Tax=Hibiscus sabdariffa TaxID=183260 RepID=A0ABR2G3B0_9ROSI